MEKCILIHGHNNQQNNTINVEKRDLIKHRGNYVMYDDIYLFIQVISAGGFTSAAQKLKTHQATISKKIIRLEEELGKTLINRNTRHLQLTNEGQYLYNLFKPHFESMDNSLENVINNDGKIQEGKLSIAMSPSLATTEINNYILDFTIQYPQIMLDIHYTLHDVNLLKDNYDMAITLSKPAQETAVIKTIWQLHTILCAAPTYIKRFGNPKNLKDLEQHKIILPLISMRSNSILEGIHTATNRLVSQKFNRHCVAVNSSTNNINFALTGKCIVPLYDCIAEEYLENGKLVRILPEYQAIPVNVYLARPTSYKNKLVDMFSNHISNCIQKLNNERITKQTSRETKPGPKQNNTSLLQKDINLDQLSDISIN